jgi:glycine oxidase
MPQSADVMIVGGGVIGLTTAYFLARRGVTVTVLDRGPMGREASWAGAGIVPPGKPENAQTPFDKLRAVSAKMMPGLSAELREATGIDNGYRVSGGVEFPGDEPIDTDAWTREGVDWQELSGDRLREVEPAFADDVGTAYFLPKMAQIRNPRHVKALVAATTARGVQLRPGCQAVTFERTGDRITGLLTSDGPSVADQYLVCAGAWSDALLQPVGCQIESAPVRGQIALLRSSAPYLSRIVMVGKRYLVPRGDGRVLVGSTEENVGFEPFTTAAGVGELLRFAPTAVPALAGAEVERCWAGLRPGSPDGLPTLGRVPGFDNLWVAAGHFRSGLQTSPATGLVMSEALMGVVPSIPLDAFRPDRPKNLTVRPTFRS